MGAWIRTITEIASIAVIVIGAALRVEHRISTLEAHILDYTKWRERIEDQLDRLWGR